MAANVKHAESFLNFVNASPTPFHAVKSARDLLEKAGFKPIQERDPWSSKLKPGGKYYLTRNASSIVAFAVGNKWKPGNPVGMVGAHTDSPCLRVKPISKKQADGYLQVGVETYGGGIWHTWFDRDLSIAGRVMVKDGKGNIAQKLVKIERPILRIPTLAIHLDRQENFSFNKETQLFPIAGLIAAELNRQGKTSQDEVADQLKKTAVSDGPFEPLQTVTTRHNPRIVELIAEEAQVDPSAILDFEMILYDTQKSCLGGLNNELVFSARLDNLMMSYCAVEGLIASIAEPAALETDRSIRMIALFDHEEIGSTTAQGADSNLLPAVLRRLSALPQSAFANGSDSSYDALEDESTVFEQTLATSFLVSADMAHSVHPNYSQKYESSHRPEMNKGPVIKINANARYATNSPGIALLQEVAQRVKTPLQLFVVRNDSPCGSTIGPMLSAKMGSRTLDLGNPQLSMHSIRECGGADDVGHAIRLFEGFFEHYGELEAKILVDSVL